MANSAKAVTSYSSVGNDTRRIAGTLGADGSIVVDEGLARAKRIAIQMLGTFNSSVQTVECSLGSSDGTFAGLPTAMTFTTAAIKMIPLGELGFNALRFTGASAGGSSAITFIIFVQEGDL